MSWKSKKVLVTGGAGFIGSNLAIRLHELGADVEVADSFSPFCGSNPFNLAFIEKNIRIHRLDLCTAPISQIVTDKEFVFHLAGQTGHLFGQQKPETDLAMNAVSTLKILEVLAKANPGTRFIFTSTRQIYGEPQYLPVDEKHPIQPLDLNGIHKRAAEEYLRMFHKLHHVPATVLRLTNTYGPRQSIRNNQLGVVGWFINRVLNDSELTLAHGGRQLRDYTFVGDVVEACLACAQEPKTIGGIYNLSGPKATLRELAGLMIRIGGAGRLGELQTSEQESQIQLKEYHGSSELLKSVTGWEPQTSLADGLARTFEFYRQNQHSYISAPLQGAKS